MKFKDKTKNRSLAFNTVSIITIVVVIVVSVVLNILISNVQNWQLDLTANKDYSMSDEAKEVLKEVGKEVEIVGLFDEIKQDLTPAVSSESALNFYTDLYLRGELNEGTYYNYYYFSSQVILNDLATVLDTPALADLSVPIVMSILDDFTALNSNIKISYVDPEQNPLFVQNYIGADAAKDFQRGDFIVKCGDAYKKVTSADLCRKLLNTSTGERVYLPYSPNVDGGFLTAIMYVTAEEHPVIGVANNHGETDIDAEFYALKQALNDNVFDIEGFDMGIDTDYDKFSIIMLLDPKSDITIAEADRIKKFLNNGGNFIVISDPSESLPEFTNINSVLAEFKLRIDNTLIQGGADETLADDSWPNNLVVPISTSYSGPLAQVITSSVGNVFVPKARSITVFKNEGGADAEVFLKTGESAHGYDFSTGENLDTGVKNVAAVSTLTSPMEGGTKVMVIGSASMLKETNTYSSAASIEVVVKICSWMEQATNYRVPIKKASNIGIEVTTKSANLIGWIGIILIPLLIMAIGVFIWIRRRYR